MLVTRYFNIKSKASDDWFDAILNSDTRLFVDPFLVFKEENGFWMGAHDKIIKHFDIAFKLIAQGNLKAESIPYKKAVHLLEFPEPRELCLGYTEKGTKGSGGGRGYAKRIAEAIASAIQRGLVNPKHFEELGILNEGIGRDRISDATCTILKSELIRYTQRVAARHGIPVSLHRLRAGEIDEIRQRWRDVEAEVPTNPFTSKPFLFVPSRFLDDLPAINATDWWASYEDERLRQDVNYHVMGKVDKATIVKMARENPDRVRSWTEQKEHDEASPYDLKSDPKGVWQWDAAAARFTLENPISFEPPSTNEGFLEVIEKVIAQYKLFVEEQGGWSLLWNDGGKPKPEDAAQLLFRGIVQGYCRANNIVIDREVELGRGPVDFKFSSGYQHRAHLEIKKEHNGKFWNGLEQQLPSYMKSDGVTTGWFLAVQFRSTKACEKRLRELPTRVRTVADANDLKLKFGVVDARRPLSASKI